LKIKQTRNITDGHLFGGLTVY